MVHHMSESYGIVIHHLHSQLCNALRLMYKRFSTILHILGSGMGPYPCAR
jgi:hypothetical protein